MNSLLVTSQLVRVAAPVLLAFALPASGQVLEPGLPLGTNPHLRAQSAPGRASFHPYSHRGSAVDLKGVRHQGSEYSGNPPWLNDRVRSIAPEYPYDERLYRHQGRGIIRLTLDVRTGLVTKATVLKSTGFVALDNSAVAAFKQWTWKPGKWKEIDLGVNFSLGDTVPPLERGAVPLSR